MRSTESKPPKPDSRISVPELPAVVRRAVEIQGRDPSDVWAPIVLAKHAGSHGERLVLLGSAVQAGLRRWFPERAARAVAWWDEPETRPFMTAVYLFGHQCAAMGRRDDAAACVKQLLDLDPQDRIGACDLAAAAGLIPDAAAGKAASVRM